MHHYQLSKLAMLLLAALPYCLMTTGAFSPSEKLANRRDALGWIAGGVAGCIAQPVLADDTPDSFDVNNYLRTGLVSQPMGGTYIYDTLFVVSSLYILRYDRADAFTVTHSLFFFFCFL